MKNRATMKSKVIRITIGALPLLTGGLTVWDWIKAIIMAPMG